MNMNSFARLTSWVGAFAGREMDDNDINTLINRVHQCSAGGSVQDVESLMIAMKDGRFIDAIKAYRSITGERLIESKEAIERHIIKKNT